MTAPACFVILGAMRTGSNLLEQIIAGLPGTICHGEVFNPAFIGGPRRGDLLGWTVGRRDADPLGLLQAMRDGAGGALPGFRLFDGHSDRVLDHVLADPSCARIVLRRDPVESFVSLKIAEQTGQWVLRNPRRRRMARVRFDPPAFDRYRARLQAHHDRIAAGMAAAGTTALSIDYDDLADRHLPDRLAGFLGLAPGIARPPSLIRQNPAALRTKVSNHAEMCAHLGLTPAPLAPQPLPGPTRLQLSAQVPVAMAPVPGPGLLPAQALVHRIDCRAGGAEPLGRGPLTARALGGTLFPTGPAEGRETFAVVSRPDRRLKWLMGQVLFTGPDGPARLILRERHPGLPESAGEWAALPAAERDGVLADFLDLVADALQDRADLPCPAAWRPQADLLDAMTAPGQAIRVFAEHDFDGLAGVVAAAAGVARFPPGQLTALASLAGPMPDDDPIPAALSARADALHARDLEVFGDLIRGEAAPG